MLKYVCMLLFVLIIHTYTLQNDLSSLRRFLRTSPNSKSFGCNEDGVSKSEQYIPKTWPKYQYKELFRDHVYRDMSPSTKEVYFAIGIHPSCVAKKGQCIRRDRCLGRKMHYISRICYKRDLVCCYEDYPPTDYKHAIIRDKEVVTTTEESKDKEKDKGKEEGKDKEEDKGKEKEEGKTDTEPPEKNATSSGKVMRREEINIGREGDKEANIKEKNIFKGSDVGSGESPHTEMNSTITAIFLPKDNKTNERSWWLVHDVTKEEILSKINPSIKVNEVDFSKVLEDFPEMTAYLDNIPPETETTVVLGKEETETATVESITKSNPI